LTASRAPAILAGVIETLAGTDVRHGYADLPGARLHYVEAGEGPPVVLLHGFPEFWYGWRFQIPALVGAGFRVIAPDMRGYNLSRPSGAARGCGRTAVSAYAPANVAADIRDLIRERGADRAGLAGHDWGAAIAWLTAINHPEVVHRLAILDVPHPRRMLEGLRTPRQLARSWYMFFFGLPWLPERLLRMGNWWAFRSGIERDARPGAFTPQDIGRYVEAWSQPGALTAMLNYYRASMRRPPSPGTKSSDRARSRAGARRRAPSRAGARFPAVEAPTLIIWGERDRYLGIELADPDPADVPRLERVVILPGVSHWVQHDEPERVSELLIEFFADRA
jgi:epoxide hydrolase 4